jgi:enoyl-CoA hydratase/carnithine racemase
MTDPEYKYLTYESLDEGAIAAIMLNRPNARNAQNRGPLVELGEAFARAEEDDTVRVVILGGHGPMFSAGHDMGSRQGPEDMAPGPISTRRRGSMAARATVLSGSCCRSGITSSRAPAGGGTSARSPSRRCTVRCSPPG